MEFDVGHMAAYAIAVLAGVRVKHLGGLSAVTAKALTVVESGVVPARILVSRVTGGAGEFAGGEAFALH